LLGSPRDGWDLMVAGTAARSGRSGRTISNYKLASRRGARLARFRIHGLASRQPGPSPLGSHDFAFTGSPRDGALGSHYHVSQWTSVSSGKRRRATLGGAAAWPGST